MFVQVLAQLALERVYRVSFFKLFHMVAILLRSLLGSFSLVHSHENSKWCLRSVILLLGFNILFSTPSLNRARSCKSLWNHFSLGFFSVQSNLFCQVFFHRRWCHSLAKVAMRWVLTNVFESYSRWGFQTHEANSKYYLDDSCFFKLPELIVFFIKPKTRLALDSLFCKYSLIGSPSETQFFSQIFRFSINYHLEILKI